MTPSRLSVVIPTRNRPALLAEALASVLCQTRLPDEILVGDDSDDPRANSRVISRLRNQHGYRPLRHLAGPTGSQAANVERLYAGAAHRWICLLHDDDLLLPAACETLLQAAEDHQARTGAPPVLVYGQQLVVDGAGREDRAASERLNAFYHRRAGQRPDLAASSLLAAIVQQSPNDGYLVDRAAAVATGYNCDPGIGQACDFAFPFRLSKLGPFYYVPQPVAKYRLTEQSIGRGQGRLHDDTALKCYLFLKQELSGRTLVEPLVREVLREKVKLAVYQAARDGATGTAWRMFFSREHLVSLPTPGFWRRGLRLVRASARRALGK